MLRSSQYTRLLGGVGLATLVLLVAGGLRGEISSHAQPTPHPGPEPPARADTDNPTVEPGRVVWHPSFDAALAASKDSGKPVLLFHLMGQLDKQFC